MQKRPRNGAHVRSNRPSITRNIINDFKNLKKNMDIVGEQMGKSQQAKNDKKGPKIWK